MILPGRNKASTWRLVLQWNNATMKPFGKTEFPARHDGLVHLLLIPAPGHQVPVPRGRTWCVSPSFPKRCRTPWALWPRCRWDHGAGAWQPCHSASCFDCTCMWQELIIIDLDMSGSWCHYHWLPNLFITWRSCAPNVTDLPQLVIIVAEILSAHHLYAMKLEEWFIRKPPVVSHRFPLTCCLAIVYPIVNHNKPSVYSIISIYSNHSQLIVLHDIQDMSTGPSAPSR